MRCITTLFHFAYAFASLLSLDKELENQVKKLFELSKLNRDSPFKNITGYWEGKRLIFDKESMNIQIRDFMNKLLLPDINNIILDYSGHIYTHSIFKHYDDMHDITMLYREDYNVTHNALYKKTREFITEMKKRNYAYDKIAMFKAVRLFVDLSPFNLFTRTGIESLGWGRNMILDYYVDRITWEKNDMTTKIFTSRYDECMMAMTSKRRDIANSSLNMIISRI
jgi:hypothetical protein